MLRYYCPIGKELNKHTHSKFKLMKKVITLLALLALPLIGSAQSDTITIAQYKALKPVMARAPFMADSINVQGRQYDPKSQLSLCTPIRLDNPLLTLVTTDNEGSLKCDSTLARGERTIQSYYLSLLTPSFEEGTMLVESESPFRLFLDGTQIGASDRSGSFEYPFSLLPSMAHKVVVRLLSNEGGASKYRLRVVPSKASSQIALSLDDKEYMSMHYMQTGESLSEVSVSPSGRYTKVVLREVVNNRSRYSVLLYEGNRLVARLDGSYLETQWMPKSDKLWFTQKSDTGKQLLTLDPATLAVTVVHPAIPEEGRFVIAPTEDRLIYMVTSEGPKNKGVVERVLGRYDTTSSFRDRDFLASFDLREGLYQPLTYGCRGTSLQDVSTNGKELIFSSSRPTTTIPFSENDFCVLDLETLKVDTLFSHETDVATLYYTSDPRYLLALGTANSFGGIGRNLPEGIPANTYDMQLFLYDREQHTAKALTKEFNPNVESVTVLPDRFEAIFTAQNQDYVSLYSLDLRTGRITQIKTTEEVVRRFDVDNKGQMIVYGGQSTMNSDRIYQINKRGEHLLYDLATSKMHDLALGTAETWSFTMPNGDVVPGRFYLPPHFDPSRKYPMIVYYYGGTSPTARNFEGSYSLPMYAAQDYVVLTLNPSGTTGWGQEYAARHLNAWGKRTADEIVASVKGFCESHPYVNAERIGCVGASYGGFMTQYLQTVTDLFAAAVSHAGISALSSYWGEGTWGVGYSTVASYGSYPWNNPKLYTEQSPLFRADKIKTPLLLLHGTADVNVPIGESVQMYNALKILGKEVEFVKIYGEDHGIYDPEKRALWMQTTMAWFQRWLKDDPTWWNSLYPEVHL